MMKRTMRQRMTAAVLAGIMVMTVAGCSSGNADHTDDGKTTDVRTYDVEKYVTLGAYDGMDVTVEGKFDVTDEDVKNYIDDMLTYYPTYEDTDKQTVENGDCVNIDYEGKKDGVAFDGGTAQGYVLEIGSHTFIDGFEDGLIGANVGDTVDLDLTFPENYQSEELAGAAVVFTVKVNKIVKKLDTTYNDLTDTFVADNLNYDTVDALYNGTKSDLEQSNEENRTVAERTAVLDKLIENSKIAVPDGLLEQKVDQYIQQFTTQNCSDGKTLSDYLSANYNMTEDDFKTTITNEMESNLDDELVLEALVKAEGETLDEKGFSEYIASAMQSGNYKTEDDLYAAYDSDYEDGRSYLEHRYLLTSALTNLIDKCNITYTGVDAGSEGTTENTESAE